VVDVQGRQVAVLAEGLMAPGRYTTNWNGTSGGNAAPVGLYFIRYQTPGQVLVKRLVLEK